MSDYTKGPMQPPPPYHQTLEPPRNAAQVGAEYRATLFAQCASGIHDPTTKYGICGILCAVLCFPWGLICLFTDSEKRCARCNIRL